MSSPTLTRWHRFKRRFRLFRKQVKRQHLPQFELLQFLMEDRAGKRVDLRGYFLSIDLTNGDFMRMLIDMEEAGLIRIYVTLENKKAHQELPIEESVRRDKLLLLFGRGYTEFDPFNESVRFFSPVSANTRVEAVIRTHGIQRYFGDKAEDQRTIVESYGKWVLLFTALTLACSIVDVCNSINEGAPQVEIRYSPVEAAEAAKGFLVLPAPVVPSVRTAGRPDSSAVQSSTPAPDTVRVESDSSSSAHLSPKHPAKAK